MKQSLGATGYHGHERQEIPEPQVKDAADQYDTARRLLLGQDPGSGVLLPLLNCSIVAVELYLKSLGARQVFESAAGSEWSKVHAEAKGQHLLLKIMDEIPMEVRQRLEAEFRLGLERDLADVLASYEGLFSQSRYSYEQSSDVTVYALGMLTALAGFLRDFVARLTPILFIDGQRVYATKPVSE